MSPTPRAALAAAILAAALAACSDSSAPLDEGDAFRGALVPAPGIMEVQNRYTPGLLRREGIIGTGIGLGASGAQEIVVYAVSPAQAAAARIPDRLEGYGVRVVVTGRVDALDYNDPTTKERPAPSGFSVGHYAITAGTIGARVKDAAGTLYILSNNHVLANSNAGSIGDAILQPGPYDGGTSADQIGTLAAFKPIAWSSSANTIDAAIALVDGADLLGATPAHAYGAPGTTPAAAALNMSVQKFGRTTLLTSGSVSEVNVTVTVCYAGRVFCTRSATFTGQIGIAPGSFSGGGDSGSLIVTSDAARSPVGLLFAGSSTRTLANPIGPVLDYFHVSIDAGGSEPPPPDTEPPVAGFTSACAKTNCAFTDASTDNVGVRAWAWDFGNGRTSTLQNPTTKYRSAGSYTVTLVVHDAAGNSSAPASRTITCAKSGKSLVCS